MNVDFPEIGRRLAVAVRESPGSGETDPEVRDFHRLNNAQRVWEIWQQCQLFDERDRARMFQTYSGLSDGVVHRYLDVCRQYQEDRATARIKEARASKAKSKKTKQKTQPVTLAT